MYGWPPDLVWHLTLSEALRYERHRIRAAAFLAELVAGLIMAPFGKPGQRQKLDAMLRKLTDVDEPQTLDERFGPTDAAAMREIDQKNVAYIKRKRAEARQVR